MEEISKQFKGQQLKFLLRLYLSSYDKAAKAATLAMMEKAFGFTPGRPDIRYLSKILIDCQALITQQDTSFGFPMYYVERKAMWKLICQQEVLSLYKQCIKLNIP